MTSGDHEPGVLGDVQTRPLRVETHRGGVLFRRLPGGGGRTVTDSHRRDTCPPYTGVLVSRTSSFQNRSTSGPSTSLHSGKPMGTEDDVNLVSTRVEG